MGDQQRGTSVGRVSVSVRIHPFSKSKYSTHTYTGKGISDIVWDHNTRTGRCG